MHHGSAAADDEYGVGAGGIGDPSHYGGADDSSASPPQQNHHHHHLMMGGGDDEAEEEIEFDQQTQSRLDDAVDKLLKGYDWTLAPLANK